MALTLTPGSESRLDGAPDLPLPAYVDLVDSVARKLVQMDADGALYGGDPSNARADAEKWATNYVKGQRGQVAAGRASAEGRAQAAAGARAAARGVSPESLPMDEYGSVSGRTVQEANRPQAAAEAALMQDQGIADEIIRGYREGDRNWQAEGDRQYSQEYGLGGFGRGAGRSDLDYRRRLQDQQGFIRTQQGMIPVGPQITPERVESMAEFDSWANQNPGTERQALYAPEDYAQFREGVRNDIRSRARQDMATYGTGPDWKLQAEADEAMRVAEAREVGQFLGNMSGPTQNMLQGPLIGTDLARLTPGNASQAGAQLAARQQRAASEEDVRIGQRGKFYRVKLEAESGLPLEDARQMTDAQLEAEGYRMRSQARNADLATRRERVQMNARLAGGQPTAASRAAVQNMMQGRDRFDDLIARLGDQNMTDWQRAGIIAGITPQANTTNPTPLGVEAVGAQNAMRAFTADVLAGNQPGVREAREAAAAGAEASLPLPVRADRERDKNEGVLPANSAAGQAVLQDIATTTVGSSYATQAEVNRAVERAVAEGIPEADAVAFFNRHAQFANSGFWGSILGAGDFGSPPAPGDNPGLPPPGSFAPPM
jgi:hypothetical protein